MLYRGREEIHNEIELITLGNNFFTFWMLSRSYIARYTDMWNRHSESEIHDIHEIGSGTKLYYLWVKGYSTWGERDTIFLCWLLLHLPQSTRGTQPQTTGLASTGPEGKLSRSDAGTHCFFSNPPNPQPTLPVHDVIHTPWSHFLFGFYFDICEWRIFPPRAREHLRSCLHLTNPCTEPKGSQPN